MPLQCCINEKYLSESGLTSAQWWRERLQPAQRRQWEKDLELLSSNGLGRHCESKNTDFF